jgi:hypothetical protein
MLKGRLAIDTRHFTELENDEADRNCSGTRTEIAGSPSRSWTASPGSGGLSSSDSSPPYSSSSSSSFPVDSPDPRSALAFLSAKRVTASCEKPKIAAYTRILGVG